MIPVLAAFALGALLGASILAYAARESRAALRAERWRVERERRNLRRLQWETARAVDAAEWALARGAAEWN